MDHAGIGPYRNHRARKDTDHLTSVAGIDDRRTDRRRCATAGLPTTDHQHVVMGVPHCDRLRRGVGIRQHRYVTDRLCPHEHPLPGERLTGVHVGDTIDLGHTVRGMTLGAQRSATGRMQTGPQECGEEMVTGNERHRHCVERELSRTGHDVSLERTVGR